MNNNFSSIIFFLKRNFMLFLAFMGITGAVSFTLAYGSSTALPSHQVTTPPSSPYEHSISGIGIVEASSRNINIGSFVPGIVTKVLVTEGEVVKKGQTLFTLDQDQANANVKLHMNMLNIARTELKSAQINLEDKEDQLKRSKGLKIGRSITIETLRGESFAAEKAKSDMQTKEFMLERAAIELELAKIVLDHTTIESPITGVVLKIRAQKGEFISGNETESNSPMLIGTHNPLYLRVQIDEGDIWRYKEDTNAIAFLRGNGTLAVPLKFVRLEPYAESKETLKGIGTKLVDTRVIEIIYKIDSKKKGIFIGQQLDVFIESGNSIQN